MCTSIADGGRRCFSHEKLDSTTNLKKRMKKAQNEQDAEGFKNARNDYLTTEEGIEKLESEEKFEIAESSGLGGTSSSISTTERLALRWLTSRHIPPEGGGLVRPRNRCGLRRVSTASPRRFTALKVSLSQVSTRTELFMMMKDLTLMDTTSKSLIETVLTARATGEMAFTTPRSWTGRGMGKADSIGLDTIVAVFILMGSTVRQRFMRQQVPGSILKESMRKITVLTDSTLRLDLTENRMTAMGITTGTEPTETE